MGFLISNWQYVAIAALAALAALFANLWQGEVKDFAEFKGAIVVLGQEAEKETKRVNDLHKQALKETNDEWAKKEPTISSNAVANYKRRFPAGLCNPSPSIVPGHASDPKTSGGAVEERVASGGVPTTGDAKTDTFIAECGKDAAKLKSLREWAAKSNLKFAP